jgi:hypothetical protein
MKKGLLSLFVGLFTCIALCLSVATSNAAPNQSNKAYIFYGGHIGSNVVQSLYGSKVDHIDGHLMITNHGNKKITNLRFKFYDQQGNNVTVDGDYYLYPNQIPAHGATFIVLNQLVQDHSNNGICSIEIIWDSNLDIAPQIITQFIFRDADNTFLFDFMLPAYYGN